MKQIPQCFRKNHIPSPEVPEVRRLMVSTEGLEGTGKTEFLLSTPDPLFILNYDDGLEGVVEKHLGTKVIGVHTVRLSPVIDKSKDGALLSHVQRIWEDACKDPGVRTVGIDTGPNLWEHIRRAEFGRLEKVPPVLYTGANACFRWFIDMAFLNNKNLVVTHFMKDEYVRGTKKVKGEDTEVELRTGKKIRAGFSNMEYRIQVNLRHLKDPDVREVPDKFSIQVLKCRPNTNVEGMVLEGALGECSFPMLAQYVFPDSTMEDWT